MGRVFFGNSREDKTYRAQIFQVPQLLSRDWLCFIPLCWLYFVAGCLRVKGWNKYSCKWCISLVAKNFKNPLRNQIDTARNVLKMLMTWFYPFYKYQNPNTVFCLITRYLNLGCIFSVIKSNQIIRYNFFVNKEIEAKGLPIQDSCERVINTMY